MLRWRAAVSRLLIEVFGHLVRKFMYRSMLWRMITSPVWLWLARLMCGVTFVALMVFEWHRWPGGSPCLGPLGFIWHNGIDTENLVLCVISLAMVFAFVLKPHALTALISLLGGVNWLFWGSLALTIGC